MIQYAQIPSTKPNNTAIYQLPSVNILGTKFYGWKMVYFKTIDTGKKNKSGKEITKPVPDKSKPVVYDAATRQLNNNNSLLVQLINGLAQQKLQNKQYNSVLVQLMNTVARLVPRTR